MNKGLGNFGAYRKSLDLFDCVAEDLKTLKKDFSLARLVSQQFASADSICSNIEEGYGRLSRKEYIRFLDFARGSARETQGRYKRFKHWLSADIVEQRINLLDEILAILSATITTLKKDETRVREDSREYGSIDLRP